MAAVFDVLACLEPRLGGAQPVHFRRRLGELHRAVQATFLLAEAEAEAESEKRDVAAFFIRRRLRRDYDPEPDGGCAPLIDRVLADD